MNTVEKYCTHCKKAGYNRKEYWILYGRPEKMQGRQQRPNNKLQEHTTALVKKKKKRNEDTDSSVAAKKKSVKNQNVATSTRI